MEIRLLQISVLLVAATSVALASSTSISTSGWSCTGWRVDLEYHPVYISDSRGDPSYYVMTNRNNRDQSVKFRSGDVQGKISGDKSKSSLSGQNKKGNSFKLNVESPVSMGDKGAIEQVADGWLTYDAGDFRGRSEKVTCIWE